jgi:hypothetical protein
MLRLLARNEEDQQIGCRLTEIMTILAALWAKILFVESRARVRAAPL